MSDQSLRYAAGIVTGGRILPNGQVEATIGWPRDWPLIIGKPVYLSLLSPHEMVARLQERSQ